MYRSTDDGSSWLHVGLDIGSVEAFAFRSGEIFGGVSGGGLGNGRGVYLSTDSGANWTNVLFQSVRALAISGTNLYAGTWLRGVLRSFDDGTNWTEVNSGLADMNIQCLAVAGTELFAGTDSGTFRSSNDGTTWTSAGSTGLSVGDLIVIGKSLYAGTTNGVFLSPDNGTTWTQMNSGLTDTAVTALAVGPNTSSGQSLFAGTSGGGVFLTTDNGTRWNAVSTDWKGHAVNTLLVSGTNLFAGTDGVGFWKRPLAEMISTSVDAASEELPSSFRLDQNYPNPFNATTQIRYQISDIGYVNLSVYDLLGREVAVLVNEKKAPGSYSVTWDASGMASGIYFLRLKAGTYVESRKMILMR